MSNEKTLTSVDNGTGKFIIAKEDCGLDIVDRLRFKAPFRIEMVKPELREDHQLLKDAADIIEDLRNQILALEREI